MKIRILFPRKIFLQMWSRLEISMRTMLKIVPSVMLMMIGTLTILFFPTSQAFAFRVNVGDDVELNIYGDAEGGMTNNRALYATFGYERQIFTINHVLLGVDGRYNLPNSHGNLFFRAEFVPLYKSIKMVRNRAADDDKIELTDKDVNEYKSSGLDLSGFTDKSDNKVKIHRYTYSLIKSPLGNVIEIDGSSEYVNWYKNQGNRLYYTEDFPLKELYLGYQSENSRHRVIFGRRKNLLGFDESETIWQEDAWFAPLSHWLSKDLYTGMSYGYGIFGLTGEIAIFSGDGNPTKNGMYYIHNVGSANKKSNNTPTFDVNISYAFEVEKWGLGGRLFVGGEIGVLGSIYDCAIEEGKHNRKLLVTGFRIVKNFDNNIFNALDFYFQYTEFVSGLRNAGGQRNHVTYKNIRQNGFFTGINLTFFKNIFQFGFTYEIFKRYDYQAHVYSVGLPTGNAALKEGKNSLDKYVDSYQQSFIINMKLFLLRNVYLNFAAHFLEDPLNWVSDALPSRGSNRYKVTLGVTF